MPTDPLRRGCGWSSRSRAKPASCRSSVTMCLHVAKCGRRLTLTRKACELTCLRRYVVKPRSHNTPWPSIKHRRVTCADAQAHCDSTFLRTSNAVTASLHRCPPDSPCTRCSHLQRRRQQRSKQQQPSGRQCPSQQPQWHRPDVHRAHRAASRRDGRATIAAPGTIGLLQCWVLVAASLAARARCFESDRCETPLRKLVGNGWINQSMQLPVCEAKGSRRRLRGQGIVPDQVSTWSRTRLAVAQWTPTYRKASDHLISFNCSPVLSKQPEDNRAVRLSWPRIALSCSPASRSQRRFVNQRECS